METNEPDDDTDIQIHPFPVSDAYLETMLRWHAEHPPDAPKRKSRDYKKRAEPRVIARQGQW